MLRLCNLSNKREELSMDKRYKAVGHKFRKENGYSIVTNDRLEMFFLDEITTRIYLFFMLPKSIQEVVQSLIKEYDVPKDKLRRDIEKLIGDLFSMDLMEEL